MLYLNKGQQNNLVLNINNNSREVFQEYVLEFTHIMSKEVKTYTIDINNPAVYFQNIRYCEILLPLDTDDLNYLGEYILNIYGDGDPSQKVYTGIVILEGTEQGAGFTEYISPNEDNSNYIYIQD